MRKILIRIKEDSDGEIDVTYHAENVGGPAKDQEVLLSNAIVHLLKERIIPVMIEKVRSWRKPIPITGNKDAEDFFGVGHAGN